MVKILSYKTSVLAVVLLSVSFILTFYGTILLNPNHHFLKASGDGLKNYFTFSYYISFNESETNFEGMNYPYGENFLFTDGHPLLSFTLKKAAVYFPDIKNYSIGILNTLLLLSMVISSVFLYFIFHKLKIQNLLAILSSVAIMALSPQIFRLGGHYALAYSCFIPITIYLLLLFETRKNKLILTILLTLNSIFWLFTHAYLGMIAIAFSASYLLFKMLYELNHWREHKKEYFYLVLSIIIPIFFFLAFLHVSDFHDGRNTNTGNLLGHSANLMTVFIPTNVHPLNPFFHSIFPTTEMHWEDLSFIGFGSDILLIIITLSLIWKSIKERKFVLRPGWLKNNFLLIALPASVLLLLFAMDFPFILGLEQSLDSPFLETIKNFRANGRFSWPFYFMITITLVYFLDYVSRNLINNNKKYLALALIILYPLSLVMDSSYYHKHVSAAVSESYNLFDYKYLSSDLRRALGEVDKDKYQAILPLPYFNKGSKSFERHFKKEIYSNSFLLSYHTAIPMMSSNLSRTSIKESKNLVQLLSSPFYEKEIEGDMEDERPFLIIKTEEGLSENEREFLEKSRLIYYGVDFQLYEMDKRVLFESTALAHFEKYNSLAPFLHPKDGFLVRDTASFLFYDSTQFSIKYRGSGAYIGKQNTENVISIFKGSDFELNSKYILRLWVYNCGPNYGQDQLDGALQLEIKNPDDEKWKKSKTHPKFSQEINGCWSMLQLQFKVKNKEAKYVLRYIGNPKSDKVIYLDDLLIYKKGDIIYRLEEIDNQAYLFENNHRIPLSGISVIDKP